MKKYITIGFCLFVIGLYTSLVNGPSNNQDLILDQEIENLLISADAKIVNIQNREINYKEDYHLGFFE